MAEVKPTPWDEINELLPPLATHRREALCESIEQNGYLGPPVYLMPDGRIIDGHHRWEITGGNCPVEVLDVDEETGKALALAHNTARRQLSHEEIREVERARKEAYKQLRQSMPQKDAAQAAGDVPQDTAKHWDKEIRSEGSDRHSPTTSAPTVVHHPAPETPAERDKEPQQQKSQPESSLTSLPDGRQSIPKSEKPKIVERADAGEFQAQIAADYGTTRERIGQIIRQERARKENEAKVEQIAEKQADGFNKLYDVIVIDPPWPMQKIDREVRPNQSAFDYPVMQEDEIKAVNLPAASDCHLFVWTTQKFLPMALRCIEHWGFRYVCTFVWHKPGGFQPIGLPQYNAEFAVYARKGSPNFVDTKAFPVCFEAKRGAHSEKPEEFYETLRRVTDGERIDMFNRREIDGFDVWGNENEKMAG